MTPAGTDQDPLRQWGGRDLTSRITQQRDRPIRDLAEIRPSDLPSEIGIARV